MIVMRQWNESISLENLLSVQNYEAANRTTLSMRIDKISTVFLFFRTFIASIFLPYTFVVRYKKKCQNNYNNNKQ